MLARGHAVTGLVNRMREVRGNDGRLLPARAWDGGAAEPGTLRLIAGDVAQERFGWSADRWREVARTQDVVLHCAAVTQFDAPRALHEAVNIEGTGRVLALAREGGCRLVHVSTAYVCGIRDGSVAEAPRDEHFPFANGYEESKARAEALVRGSDVPAAIARPSVVVGEWASGAIRDFDTIYAAFRLIAEGRVRTLSARAEATIDFVPIDHVAGGLTDLLEYVEVAAGRVFHLVSGAPVPVGAFRDAIARQPQFAAPMLVEPAAFDPAALSAPERRLHARVAGLYGSYFQRAPRFEDANLRALTGRRCPPTDAAFLDRLIGYGIDAGYLPTPVRETA